jgi:hypothetical protein
MNSGSGKCIAVESFGEVAADDDTNMAVKTGSDMAVGCAGDSTMGNWSRHGKERVVQMSATYIAVRKGADSPVETGSGIERREGQTSQGKKCRNMAEKLAKTQHEAFQT